MNETALSGDGRQARAPRSPVSRRGILASAAAAGVLSACGEASRPQAAPTTAPPKAPVTVEVHTPFVDIPGRVIHRRWIDEGAARLKQRMPHITVDHRPTTGDFINIIITRLAAGDPMDLTHLTNYGPWQNEKAFLNLSPKITRDKFDLNIYVPFADRLKFKNGVYGLPFQEVPQILYLNVTMFKKRGIPFPSETWTWDDYLSIAQKLTADGDFGLLHRPLWEETWLTFLRSAGGDWINPERTKTTLDTGPARDAFQWLVDLHLKHKVAMDVRDQQYGTGDQPFLRGKVGMTTRHSGFIPMVQEQVKDFEWDITTRPLNPRTRQRVDLHTQSAWGLPADSKKQDDAWEAMKELGGEWAADFIGKNKIYTPTTKKALSDKTGFVAPPPANSAAILKVLEKPSELQMFKNFPEWSAELQTLLGAAFTGEKGVNDVLTEATRIGDSIINK